jgi:hypothetical protein
VIPSLYKLGFELLTAKEARIQRGYLERKDEDEPLNRLFNTSPVFSQNFLQSSVLEFVKIQDLY